MSYQFRKINSPDKQGKNVSTISSKNKVTHILIDESIDKKLLAKDNSSHISTIKKKKKSQIYSSRKAFRYLLDEISGNYSESKTNKDSKNLGFRYPSLKGKII